MTSCTFVVFTFNEAERLPWVIRNFIKEGTVLVVDNHSTDSTVAIARAHGCEVLMNKNAGWVEDEVTAANVKAAVKTEWIYWGYADEILPQAALVRCREIIAAGDHDIIQIARKNHYHGRFCSDACVSSNPRFFRKEAIDFTGNQIHGLGRITVAKGRIYNLPSQFFVHHFISYTSAAFIGSYARYLELERSRPAGVNVHLLFLLINPLKHFLLNFLWRRGFSAGLSGLHFVIFQALYRLLTVMRGYEMTHGLDRTSIEAANNATRQRLIAEIQGDDPGGSGSVPHAPQGER